jgi:hypothetical protein
MRRLHLETARPSSHEIASLKSHRLRGHQYCEMWRDGEWLRRLTLGFILRVFLRNFIESLPSLVAQMHLFEYTGAKYYVVNPREVLAHGSWHRWVPSVHASGHQLVQG